MHTSPLSPRRAAARRTSSPLSSAIAFDTPPDAMDTLTSKLRHTTILSSPKRTSNSLRRSVLLQVASKAPGSPRKGTPRPGEAPDRTTASMPHFLKLLDEGDQRGPEVGGSRSTARGRITRLPQPRFPRSRATTLLDDPMDAEPTIEYTRARSPGIVEAPALPVFTPAASIARMTSQSPPSSIFRRAGESDHSTKYVMLNRSPTKRARQDDSEKDSNLIPPAKRLKEGPRPEEQSEDMS
ncbi:hypothetical protein NMY22_g18442 [Coprinellus aureogranulatus]|nr:hypothetical protein NMY22_g18442 [Coprinellus aureogranulatus]